MRLSDPPCSLGGGGARVCDPGTMPSRRLYSQPTTTLGSERAWMTPDTTSSPRRRNLRLSFPKATRASDSLAGRASTRCMISDSS